MAQLKMLSSIVIAFLLAGGAGSVTPLPLSVHAKPPVLVGSSVNATTHYWFPQHIAPFLDGETLVLQVQLADDGCKDPTCRNCHKPCSPSLDHKMSTDGGVTWTRLTNDEDESDLYDLGSGGVMISDHVYMSTGAFVKAPSMSDTFTSQGKTLTLEADSTFTRGTTSNNITFTNIPSSLLNATKLIRWTAVATTAKGKQLEIAQFELPSPVGNRALTLFTSTDNYTWEYQGTIATKFPYFSNYTNGPCEAAVTAMQNGTIVTIFRVDSFANYHMSVSHDGGVTWTNPAMLPGRTGSVRPRLTTYSGVNGEGIILVGGRPGLMLWASDSALQSWTEFNIALTHNSLYPNTTLHYNTTWADREVFPSFSDHQSTAYTSLIRKTATSFLVVYDFLAHGWDGPPGIYGANDHVFAMEIEISSSHLEDKTYSVEAAFLEDLYH